MAITGYGIGIGLAFFVVVIALLGSVGLWGYFIRESSGRTSLSYGEEIYGEVPAYLPPIANNPCYHDIFTCSSDDRDDYCREYYPHVSNVRLYCQSFCRNPHIEDVGDEKCESEELCHFLADEYSEFEVRDGFDVCYE